MDIEYCLTRIHDTVASLERVAHEFHSFYVKFNNKCSKLGSTESKAKEAIKNDRKLVLCNILESISCQMKDRFVHFGELAFLGLLDCAKFREMSLCFDDKKVQSLSKYAKFCEIKGRY